MITGVEVVTYAAEKDGSDTRQGLDDTFSTFSRQLLPHLPLCGPQQLLVCKAIRMSTQYVVDTT